MIWKSSSIFLTPLHLIRIVRVGLLKKSMSWPVSLSRINVPPELRIRSSFASCAILFAVLLVTSTAPREPPFSTIVKSTRRASPVIGSIAIFPSAVLRNCSRCTEAFLNFPRSLPSTRDWRRLPGGSSPPVFRVKRPKESRPCSTNSDDPCENWPARSSSLLGRKNLFNPDGTSLRFRRALAGLRMGKLKPKSSCWTDSMAASPKPRSIGTAAPAGPAARIETPCISNSSVGGFTGEAIVRFDGGMTVGKPPLGLGMTVTLSPLNPV